MSADTVTPAITPTAIDAYVFIESIRVVGRHRKDLGDVEGLALSIEDVGLLNPVTITSDNQLVAGQRRIEACRLLGWDNVPVRIVADLDEAARLLTAERDENICRKDMTPSELVSLGRALEELHRPAAKERMAAGQSNGGKARHGCSPQESRGEQDRNRSAETASIVGDALGIGRARYHMAKQITRLAGDETEHPDVREAAQAAVKQMDETGVITTAYEGVKKALRRDRARKDAAEAKAAALADPEPEAVGHEGGQLDPSWVPHLRDNSATAVQQRRKLIAYHAERALSSRQIAETLGMGDEGVRKIAKKHGIAIPADAIVGRTKRIDSNRVARETVYALEGAAMSVQLVNPDELDRAELTAWAASLTTSLRSLNRFAKQLKEMAS